jgi:hypothetical protein
VRIVAGMLAIVGAALLAFGWWGLETAAGRAAFDEMAGMIPFGAQVLGAALILIAAVITGVRYWRSPSHPGR